MRQTHEYQSHFNKVKATFLYALLWLGVALFIALVGFPKDGVNWLYLSLVVVTSALGVWKLYQAGEAKKQFDNWKEMRAK